MLISLVLDAAFALFSAFAIIYILGFSFYCIFLSNGTEVFTFENLCGEIKKIDREE